MVSKMAMFAVFITSKGRLTTEDTLSFPVWFFYIACFTTFGNFFLVHSFFYC